MRPLRGCPAMFTILLLLSCFAAASVGDSLWASPLPVRCGGPNCSRSASQSVHDSSARLSTTPGLALLNHRSDNTFSALRSGTRDAAKSLRSLHHGKLGGGKRNSMPAAPTSFVIHDQFRGETSTAGHHQTPSTSGVYSTASDVVSGQHLSDESETYFSRKHVEKVGVKYVSDEGTTVSSVYWQRSNHERQVSKADLNKLYTEVTLNGRHWSDRLSSRTSPKQNMQKSWQQGNVSTRKSSESDNWPSSGVLRKRFWKHHNSMASAGELVQTVKEHPVTLSSVDNDVISLGDSAAAGKEQPQSESPLSSARELGISPQNANVPSLPQPTASLPQPFRISVEGQLSGDYRPSGTPDTHERIDHGETAASKSEDNSTDAATLPLTSVSEDVFGQSDDSGVEPPDSDLLEQKEELEESIARDATLIIVFGCLAVASLVMWRIIRCITIHKIKQYEKKLEAQKATTV
ncbi:uncharacterized protein LOC126336766 isoform X2 [Schistocerca gregaria]|uniref:uncharacterized protein LOC126336766 isoform X2 n=1 Tax=Schistocerca gregaria TaxID=7010 RepID=UPI00211E1EE3|nr:uncharacterized protein LOC126336766 isoform X2 [Schistocerca gregaria]